MTTLIPRPAYSDDEIARLYPKHLRLQLVQVVRITTTIERDSCRFLYIIKRSVDFLTRSTAPSPWYASERQDQIKILINWTGERTPVSTRFQNVGFCMISKTHIKHLPGWSCAMYDSIDLLFPMSVDFFQFGLIAGLQNACRVS